MNDSVINSLPAHTPMYAMLSVIALLSIWFAVKVCFSAKASSREKRKEWVLSRQLDAEGLPLLSDDLRRPSGGFPYPTGTNPRSRR